jgi:hypothetical protein
MPTNSTVSVGELELVEEASNPLMTVPLSAPYSIDAGAFADPSNGGFGVRFQYRFSGETAWRSLGGSAVLALASGIWEDSLLVFRKQEVYSVTVRLVIERHYPGAPETFFTSGTQAVDVPEESEAEVFPDLDNDGIPDEEDPDDDNDGIPDEEDEDEKDPNLPHLPENPGEPGEPGEEGGETGGGGMLPGAPGGLGSAGGTGEVCEGPQATLTWEPVTGATGYRLRRNGEPIYYGANTFYLDTAVLVGVAYSYTVTAYNGAGEGPASVALVVTPCSDTEEPPPPTGGGGCWRPVSPCPSTVYAAPPHADCECD